MAYTPQTDFFTAENVSTLSKIDQRLTVEKLCRADDLCEADQCESITALGLSNRAYNAMIRMKVVTVSDLLGFTVYDLISAQNMGRKSVWDVLICLYRFVHGTESMMLYSPPTVSSSVLFHGVKKS